MIDYKKIRDTETYREACKKRQLKIGRIGQIISKTKYEFTK